MPCLHRCEGIDTGDIIRQQSFPITDADDDKTLLEKAYIGCAELLDWSVQDILEGQAERRAQKDISPFGSYCLMAGQMPPVQSKKIKRFICDNQEELLEKWHELSG